MFKSIRNAIGNAVSGVRNGISSFFGGISDGVRGAYERITGSSAERIEESREGAAEEIRDIAEDVQSDETAIVIEEIADEIDDGELPAEFMQEDEHIEDAVDDYIERTSEGEPTDDFYEQFDTADWPSMPEGAAIDDGEMYHMSISYTVVLDDGTIIEREIERYNYYDDDTINGMIWEHLFAEGDGDGGDIDSGSVEGVSYSISIW